MTTSSSPRLKRAVLLGIAVAFVVSVLGISGVPLTANPLRADKLTLTADFSRTVGLYPQSRVVVQGIRAGTVTSVKPSGDRVRVRMKLSGVQLAPDAIATIRLKSLIGERYVDLSPVWAGSGAHLRNGAHIPLARTRVPAEVSEFLDEATRLAERLDSRALGHVVEELGKALGNNSGAVAEITTGLADVGQAVAGRTRELDASLGQLSRVVGTLAARDEEVVRILRSSTAVSQALLAQQGALDGAVKGLDTLLGTLSGFTARQKGDLADAVHLLAGTGKLLAEHERGWQRIIDTIPYYAYGWHRAIHHDGTHWFFAQQAAGLMFLPYPHAMNEDGGPGADEDDHTVMPHVNWSCSPARATVPYQVDATKATGGGPLIPAQKIGDRITIDNEPGQAFHSPGYEGGPPETATPPDPSNCDAKKQGGP